MFYDTLTTIFFFFFYINIKINNFYQADIWSPLPHWCGYFRDRQKTAGKVKPVGGLVDLFIFFYSFTYFLTWEHLLTWHALHTWAWGGCCYMSHSQQSSVLTGSFVALFLCMYVCTVQVCDAVQTSWVTPLLLSFKLCDGSPLTGHEFRLPGTSTVNTSLPLMALPIHLTVDC